jgi:RNase P/RNase MRP subunit POP5
MKPLKPSHREHKRYLLVSGKDANKKDIEEAILKYVGILGYANACPDFPRLEKPKEGKVVFSINRKELDKIRAALLVSGKDIKIERVSGMIKNL